MIVLHIDHGKFSGVPHDFFADAVGGVGLLQQGVSDVAFLGFLDGLVDGRHIVAVDFLGVEAKARHLFRHIAMGQDVVRRAVQLVAVVVDEVDDIVQLAQCH